MLPDLKHWCLCVGELLIVFPDLVFLPFRAGFLLLKVVEVNALGPPHDLELWLEVGKVMLPMKHIFTLTTFFASVEFQCNHRAVTKMSYVWPPAVIGIFSRLEQCCLSV